jgi:hypothetical protein
MAREKKIKTKEEETIFQHLALSFPGRQVEKAQ